jgi:hypothetical protein
MGPYGSQIPTHDRWAIVLYVKSLQATRANEPPPVPAVQPAADTPESIPSDDVAPEEDMPELSPPADDSQPQDDGRTSSTASHP